MSKHIMISAGEPSGDEHAANLVNALKRFSPGTTFSGMGGSKLRNCGVHLVVDSEVSGSVMGFFEILGSLRSIFSSLNILKRHLEEQKPDLLIVVDYPDFHFRLIKAAKKLGIPILFYITPKVWIWRKNRIDFFKRYVDCAATIFPFEPEFFQKHGYEKAFFVGHPFTGNSDYDRRPDTDRQAFFEELNLNANQPTLAVFPGSRKKEIELHSQVLFEGIHSLQQKYPDIQVLVSTVESVREELLKKIPPELQSIRAISGKNLDILHYADAGVIKSGTSNLQAAFCELPFVMFYKSTAVSEFLIWLFLFRKEYSIVNLIQTETIEELLGKKFAAQNICEEAERLLFDKEYSAQVRSQLQMVTEKLSEPPELEIFSGCSTSAERTAKLALNLIDSHL